MPITDEELKAIFQANDYSTYKPKFDSKKANENDQYINDRIIKSVKISADGYRHCYHLM